MDMNDDGYTSAIRAYLKALQEDMEESRKNLSRMKQQEEQKRAEEMKDLETPDDPCDEEHMRNIST